MNILVTGSNGFVGRNIVAFIKDCHHIIGCGKKSLSLIDVDEYIRWDLGNDDIPESLLSVDIDCIIHCSASLDKNNDSEDLVKVNCIGTHRLYRLSKIKKIKCFILISSIPIIGVPSAEITESTQLDPLSIYHATKVSQEMIINTLKVDNIRPVALRIPSPIGPGLDNNSIVPVFIKNALMNKELILCGNGTRRQNYIDVRDVAKAVSLSIENTSVSGVYNVASEFTYSNIEIAKMCIDICNSASKIQFNGLQDPCDDHNWIVNTDKFKTAVNYRPTYNIHTTLSDMIRYITVN